MSTTPKYQVFVCPQCHCRRRIYCTRDGDNYVWRRTVGDTWTCPVPTLEKIIETIKAGLVPMLKQAFERDNTFYRAMGRHR